MKVSDFIADFLSDRGVDIIFGNIGGFNNDILDSVHQKGKIKFVLNYHEQASAFAANAYALVSGKVGVVTASGAPGNCNTIAGIANAYFDSIPCVFLSGCIHSASSARQLSVRQSLFEEIDMAELVKPITKFSYKIQSAEEILYYLEKAFYIANHGRKGPVLLDIPYNISRADIDVSDLKHFIPENNLSYDEIDCEKIILSLKNSSRPILLVGGGMRSAEAKQLLAKFLDRYKIPVVSTLLGMDIVSHDHPCYLGFIGHYGHRWANLALSKSDCVIVLGARLDERQMGGYKSRFAQGAVVIRADLDKNELLSKFYSEYSYCISTEKFLEQLLACESDKRDYLEWKRILESWKNRFLLTSTDNKFYPIKFIRKISESLPAESVVTADVGQNQMSVAQGVYLSKSKKLLNCGGYGSMGFALPAAVGAAYTSKKPFVLCVCGDGGLQMNIQELQTVIRDNLPIMILVVNNKCLGMIRRLQENMYEGRKYGSVIGYSAPNFKKIAEGYGYTYVSATQDNPQFELINELIQSGKPSFVELSVISETENYPEPGDVLDNQYPLLTDKELQQLAEDCCFE